MTEQNAALAKVRSALGPEALAALEKELSPTELTSLLLGVAQSRAAAVTPSRLLEQLTGRFTAPAAADPRLTAAREHRLWDLLPEAFEGVELSPLAPLGASSALAGVSQHRVVSTTRGSEVVSDATNVLAIEAARRRASAPVVHLAASHRLVRAQALSSPAHSAHFRLFSLVSSARDQGSGRTEAELVLAHFGYWARVLEGRGARVDCTVFQDGAVAERLRDTVVPGLQALGFETGELAERTGADYYRKLAFKVYVGGAEVGDGGLTDWTAKLRSDAKERCFISCVATERL